MIRVRCLGHIGTALGSSEVDLDDAEIEAAEIVERLRSRVAGDESGFSKYNTLVMVEDGEAFVPASVKRKVRSGERVVLIPFSHGG